MYHTLLSEKRFSAYGGRTEMAGGKLTADDVRWADVANSEGHRTAHEFVEGVAPAGDPAGRPQWWANA